ncbi:hypothetical protein E1281_01435 [Actinomadura sp. KC345]|uniref:hypothetical protein n=1 Tax=Actinomadura sp. KC345 TaxID=2530371 RepID=UPI0010450EFB|nr:hypothetical protein [Actinomadura sp. KC345]TDC58488.1 hypothetical protein E1281_01435 [Actinomadura sp. KC345]
MHDQRATGTATTTRPRRSILVRLIAVCALALGGIAVAPVNAHADSGWRDGGSGGVCSFVWGGSSHFEIWPRDDGRCGLRWFGRNAKGLADAEWVVSRSNHCGDAFCSIQYSPERIVVFRVFGCDTFFLRFFERTTLARNHGSLKVGLGGLNGEYAEFWSGRRTKVNWNTWASIQTCRS